MRGLLSQMPLARACGECERGKRGECACVCVRAWMREVCESAPRELLGETRCRGDAVRSGPPWLQRHGCEFVTSVLFEARGGEHADAKWGKERLYFESWPRPGKGNIYTTKYATCEVAI